MYSVEDILKNLSAHNYFLEKEVLSDLIKSWKIDPVYEDDDGVEYFDSFSIIKIKKGLKLKSQAYTNEQIVYKLGNLLDEKNNSSTASQEFQQVEQAPMVTEQNADLKTFTVDITSQTLQLLADAVANKITNSIKSEIKNQFKDEDLIEELFPYAKVEPNAELKKDNEELAKKVEELLEDNKKMAQRLEKMEKQKFSLLSFIKKIIKPA